MNIFEPFSRAMLQRLLFLLLTGVLLDCLSGCVSSGGSRPPVFQEIAETNPPAIRDLLHHPDSLVHIALSVENGDTALTVDSTWSPLEVHEEWTSEPGSSGFSSFATLQSLELILARASRGAPSAGEHLQAYRKHVQIDVCRFSNQSRGGRRFVEKLSRPGVELLLRSDTGNRRIAERIELRRQGSLALPYKTNYSPFTDRSDQLEENAASVQYRCDAVCFKRVVDGVNILQEFSRLEFIIRYKSRGEATYTWTLPRGETVSARRSRME